MGGRGELGMVEWHTLLLIQFLILCDFNHVTCGRVANMADGIKWGQDNTQKNILKHHVPVT